MRLLCVLAKIAKGLHYERTTQVLGPEMGWRFASITASEFFVAPVELATREVADVLAARFVETPSGLGWWLAFCGSVFFAVIAMTPERIAADDSGAYAPRRLTWPKAL